MEDTNMTKQIIPTIRFLTLLAGGISLAYGQDNNLPSSLQAKLKARFAQDENVFGAEKVREIELAYREATRQYGTPASIEPMKQFVAKYPKSNRAGCVVLYLAETTTGKEREAYLKTAIADYSDTLPGDLKEVGANARFELGMSYLDKGRRSEAKELFQQIRTQYPDSLARGDGKSLVEILPDLK